jgi:hypothetical protein
MEATYPPIRQEEGMNANGTRFRPYPKLTLKNNAKLMILSEKQGLVNTMKIVSTSPFCMSS